MKGAKLKKNNILQRGKGKSRGGENKNCTSTRKQKFNKKTKKNDTQQALQKLVDSC